MRSELRLPCLNDETCRSGSTVSEPRTTHLNPWLPVVVRGELGDPGRALMPARWSGQVGRIGGGRFVAVGWIVLEGSREAVLDNRLIKPEPALNATPSVKLSPV